MGVRVLLPVENDIGAELPDAEGSLPSLFARRGGAGAVGTRGLLTDEGLVFEAVPLADAAAAETSKGFEGAVEEDTLNPA